VVYEIKRFLAIGVAGAWVADVNALHNPEIWQKGKLWQTQFS
jgi:hypothetical protein